MTWAGVLQWEESVGGSGSHAQSAHRVPLPAHQLQPIQRSMEWCCMMCSRFTTVCMWVDVCVCCTCHAFEPVIVREWQSSTNSTSVADHHNTRCNLFIYFPIWRINVLCTCSHHGLFLVLMWSLPWRKKTIFKKPYFNIFVCLLYFKERFPPKKIWLSINLSAPLQLEYEEYNFDM